MPNHANRAWQCLPALVLYCCDVTITLVSQPPVFWAGTYTAVEEGNPVARVILLLGPWMFIAAALLWALTFSTVILLGHRSVAMALSFGLTIAHALGTAFWLPRHGLVGMVAAVLVLVAAERLLTWSSRTRTAEFEIFGPPDTDAAYEQPG